MEQSRRAARIVGRLAMVAAAVVATLAGPACVEIVSADRARYTDRVEKQFAVTGVPDVTLATFDGAIEVRPWDKPEVHVTVEKRGRTKEATDTIDVKVEHDGNRVSVEARVAPQHLFSFRVNDARSARLIVSVPAKANVHATSGDGSIDIERVDGRLELRSGDGSIRAQDVAGDLDVHTGDGTVKVAGRLARLRARSGDGSITIDASPGSAPAGDWDVTTGDGSVTIAIPENFAADLDAHTGDGGIRTDGVTVADVTGRIGRDTLRGRIGQGGHTLRIHSGDGSITIRRAGCDHC